MMKKLESKPKLENLSNRKKAVVFCNCRPSMQYSVSISIHSQSLYTGGRGYLTHVNAVDIYTAQIALKTTRKSLKMLIQQLTSL